MVWKSKTEAPTAGQVWHNRPVALGGFSRHRGARSIRPSEEVLCTIVLRRVCYGSGLPELVLSVHIVQRFGCDCYSFTAP